MFRSEHGGFSNFRPRRERPVRIHHATTPSMRRFSLARPRGNRRSPLPAGSRRRARGGGPRLSSGTTRFARGLSPGSRETRSPARMALTLSKALVEKFHLPQLESERKLLVTFYPKRNYIIHYRNLKLYLELGLKLKVIHRVLKFSQSAFLKDFIDFNHNLRKQATNAFQKNLSKLIMNSIYGKTIEDPRQYNNVVISVSEDEVLKNLQKPNLRQFAAISPTVVIFQFSQRTLHLNKPV
ncbi:unnamed protein product [Ixodes persulcatus]